MGQTNGTATPFDDQLSDSEQEVQNAEDNLQEYNMLTPNELELLKNDNSPEGLERLRELAEQYDIPFEGFTPEQIVQRIISLQSSQDASYMYNGTE